MSDFRTEIREAFEKEQSAFPPSGALRAEIVAALNSHAGAPAQPPSRSPKTLSLQWAAGFVAVFLTVALIAGLIYSRSSVAPSGSASLGVRSTAERAWGPVSMMSGTIGWADPQFGGHPMRTTDGGAHWTDVSPPKLLVGSASHTHFLDADHAWVAEASWGSRVQIVSLGTEDGGRTWQPGAQITLHVGTVSSAGSTVPGGLHLYFLDPEHGWLFVDAILQSQTNVEEAHLDALYHTNDGGLRWVLLSTNAWSFMHAPATSGCPWGAPVFITLTTGFMYSADRTYEAGKTTNCTVPDRTSLHVTHDGGVTWQFQPLPAQLAEPLGSLTVVDAPDFADQLHGFLVLESGLLATSDGGRSWQMRSFPGSNFYGISWLDTRNGWAWSGNPTGPLYRTIDGGSTWSTLQTNLAVQTPVAEAVSGLNFVDKDTGFAFTRGDTGGYNVLLKTADGGYIWKVVGTFK